MADVAEQAILTLVRHGETPANTEGVWHGSTDSPLTERGRLQAERVASHCGEQRDGYHALYTSDLQRAFLTAQAISKTVSLEPVVDVELREYDLGEWEGKTYRELNEQHRLWHHMRSDPDYAPHGGESPRQVATRFTGALRRIAGSHPGERVIVVAHGGALSMAFGELIDGDFTQWRRVMDNAAVTELALEPEPSLLRFNHTAHLDGI